MPKGIPKNGINKGWFKSNHEAWNTGTRGVMKPNKGSYKRGEFANELHKDWKGEEASYTAKHQWLRRKYGSPQECEHCFDTSAKRYEWANLSGEYRRDISDWRRLCVSCHRIFDGHSYKATETKLWYV